MYVILFPLLTYMKSNSNNKNNNILVTTTIRIVIIKINSEHDDSNLSHDHPTFG